MLPAQPNLPFSLFHIVRRHLAPLDCLKDVPFSSVRCLVRQDETVGLWDHTSDTTQEFTVEALSTYWN